MNVFVECHPNFGVGIKRVVSALKAYRPSGVRIATSTDSADLVVHHVVGVQNFRHLSLPRLLAQQRRPYAMVQYCLRTTERPDTSFWAPLWRDARAVWSYYDLAAACRTDRASAEGIRFYHAPLGVDGDIFRASDGDRPYLIGTSGYVAETEGVRECEAATRSCRARMFHLGPDLQFAPHVTARSGLSDTDVAAQWAQCRFVAALRRVEGFELPAVEGLACGARPLAFDQPHYRQWFGEHAEYVPEGDPTQVTEAIARACRRRPRPVTSDERAAVLARFDWSRIARGFWEAVA